MSDHIVIDGAAGEGGGQILRSALALSLVTLQPFRIERIRAGREKPGLLRQHLTAVQAAALVGGGRVRGAELGSSTLEFEPSEVRGGTYHLAVGTAGSATLVLQAVLPALLMAREPSRLTLEGGTHNPFAPPFDFFAKTFVPTLRRMGAHIDVTLERHGFYPAGGGRFTVDVSPSARLDPLSLVTRGQTTIRARALIASLPERIARRELARVQQRLSLDRTRCEVDVVTSSAGPGNVLMIDVESSSLTEVITGFGMKGVTSEQVAARACDEVRAYVDADVPVGRYLADQLLVPMALAGASSIRTMAPTAHTTTNIEVIRRFLDVPIVVHDEDGVRCRIDVGHAGKEGV